MKKLLLTMASIVAFASTIYTAERRGPHSSPVINGTAFRGLVSMPTKIPTICLDAAVGSIDYLLPAISGRDIHYAYPYGPPTRPSSPLFQFYANYIKTHSNRLSSEGYNYAQDVFIRMINRNDVNLDHKDATGNTLLSHALNDSSQLKSHKFLPLLFARFHQKHIPNMPKDAETIKKACQLYTMAKKQNQNHNATVCHFLSQAPLFSNGVLYLHARLPPDISDIIAEYMNPPSNTGGLESGHDKMFVVQYKTLKQASSAIRSIRSIALIYQDADVLHLTRPMMSLEGQCTHDSDLNTTVWREIFPHMYTGLTPDQLAHKLRLLE